MLPGVPWHNHEHAGQLQANRLSNLGAFTRVCSRNTASTRCNRNKPKCHQLKRDEQVYACKPYAGVPAMSTDMRPFMRLWTSSVHGYQFNDSKIIDFAINSAHLPMKTELQGPCTQAMQIQAAQTCQFSCASDPSSRLIIGKAALSSRMTIPRCVGSNAAPAALTLRRSSASGSLPTADGHVRKKFSARTYQAHKGLAAT